MASNPALGPMVSNSTSVYTPLDASKGEIRILSLHPGNLVDNIVVNLDIIQIEDISNPDFEAVSYRWGSPNREHQISLNGEPFAITSSQDRMIRDLRNSLNMRRLWIDALCINQKDLRERNHQVQIMRQIYMSARAVLIWLDHEIDEAALCFSKFLTFDSDCKPEQILEEDDYFWEPICLAVQSEYFDRLWVQQEMSNAKSISIQCRRTSLPTTCFQHFVDAWHTIHYKVMIGDTQLDRVDSISWNPTLRLWRLLSGNGNTLTTNDRPGLLEVLHCSIELKCADERDMVYGIMYLAHDWRQGDLPVDYSLSVSSVFKQTICSYFNTYGSLAFLEHTNFSYHTTGDLDDELPSWVPDWRKHCHCGNLFQQAPEARRKSDDLPVAQISGNFLYTIGVKITEVSISYPDFLTESVPAYKFFEVFEVIISESKSPGDPARRFAHLASLLTESSGSFYFEINDVVAEIVTAFKRISYLIRAAADNSGLRDPAFTLTNLMVVARDAYEETNEDAFLVLWDIKPRLVFARLTGLQPFVSQRGSIGLAPLQTRPGDEIWLFPTCKSPIVLRPDKGRYFVLGKACLGKEDPWHILGQTLKHLTEGEEINGHRAEAICLQ